MSTFLNDSLNDYFESTPSINIGGKIYDFRIPKVMGIVNVTPDSFFSGSRTSGAEEIGLRVERLRAEGADMIDIGGYSSRRGADDVSPEEEYRRLELGLGKIREIWPEAVVSVDTFRAGVAQKCIDNFGVQIINDISGGTLDPEMWDMVAQNKVGYVLMHMRGTPSTMKTLTDYDDVTADVLRDLAEKCSKLRSMGVADIILDPGFGFAKTVEQNFQILRELREFRRLGLPVLAGMSRKTMIWKTLGCTPEESLNGTVVLDTVALMNGADILRVHDVAQAVESVKLIYSLRGYSL